MALKGGSYDTQKARAGTNGPKRSEEREQQPPETSSGGGGGGGGGEGGKKREGLEKRNLCSPVNESWSITHKNGMKQTFWRRETRTDTDRHKDRDILKERKQTDTQ